MLTIFLNGRFIKVPPADFARLLPGELDGKGAFETMRMYGGVVFAFRDHMNRLRRGLNHFGMTLPTDAGRSLQVITDLSRRNRLANARVRVIVWIDKGRRNISISLEPLALPSPAMYRRGYDVMIAGIKRSRSRDSHVKSINYRTLRRVFREAQRQGFHEALLLNRKGEMVEGTRTNIFWVRNNVLCTPAIRCGGLNGITRQKVIRCAKNLRIPVRFMRTGPEALARADEIFLTGSTLEIMPVARVKGKWIRKKMGSPVASRLHDGYKQMVKREVSNCPSKRRLV